MAEPDSSVFDTLLEPFRGQKGSTIAALKAVQEHFGYISGEAIDAISEHLSVSRNTVYGIASYYETFHLEPVSRHVIRYCMGTVCDALGGRKVLAELSSKLGIRVAEESPDRNWSLERLPCFGTCARGPMMLIDDRSYTNLTPDRIDPIISGYEQGKPAVAPGGVRNSEASEALK
jgi:NADH-quinone oxidoreductase subunit E